MADALTARIDQLVAEGHPQALACMIAQLEHDKSALQEENTLLEHDKLTL